MQNGMGSAILLAEADRLLWWQLLLVRQGCLVAIRHKYCFVPATTIGCKADFQLKVLKTKSSPEKNSKASTNDIKVAPVLAICHI